MTLRPQSIYIPSTPQHLENGVGRTFVIFHAWRLNLTLDEVFEAGAFDAKQSVLAVGTLLRVNATDGRCWAEVMGITDNGRLVIEPDTAVARRPDAEQPATRRTPSRRAA